MSMSCREVMGHFKPLFSSGTSDPAKIRPLKVWAPVITWKSLSTLTSRATHAHPTSPRSTGFCAIWDCISSSSSSKSPLFGNFHPISLSVCRERPIRFPTLVLTNCRVYAVIKQHKIRNGVQKGKARSSAQLSFKKTGRQEGASLPLPA